MDVYSVSKKKSGYKYFVIYEDFQWLFKGIGLVMESVAQSIWTFYLYNSKLHSKMQLWFHSSSNNVMKCALSFHKLSNNELGFKKIF